MKTLYPHFLALLFFLPSGVLHTQELLWEAPLDTNPFVPSSNPWTTTDSPSDFIFPWKWQPDGKADGGIYWGDREAIDSPLRWWLPRI